MGKKVGMEALNAILKIVNSEIKSVKSGVDVASSFITEDGYGNLRYYNGKFQYYDTSSQSWIDTSVSPDNPYIINMIPDSMQFVLGIYDNNDKVVKLRFKEPEDTVINGQVASVVEKIVIRRKLGSCPANENDGILVGEIGRADFGRYENTWFTDSTLTNPVKGDKWFYKLFPTNTLGFVNNSTDNETGSILVKDYTLYGFNIDQTESNPNTRVTYIADNKNFRHAYMNFTTDSFDYGDWDDAWFIKNLRPCMVGYDGEVKYYLNKNNYALKADNTASSDITNTAFEGNAMMEFPKVYWYIKDNGDNTGTVYFSDKKVNENFNAWAHHDNNGNIIPYVYRAIYNGAIVNGKLRSLSGLTPETNTTRQQEITYAKANNLENSDIHNIDEFSFITLLQLLTILIGKSTNSKDTFGHGNNNSYVSTSNTGIKKTGTMDNKGLFWGKTDNTSGVKVWGFEHFWGNRWNAVAGMILKNGIYNIKMTYGTEDGSTTTGYNLDGTGYVAIPGSTPSGTSGGYITKCILNPKCLIPITINGSSSTFYSDGLWFNNSGIMFLLFGGVSDDALRVGVLCSSLYDVSSLSYWNLGSSLYIRTNASEQIDDTVEEIS